MFLKELCHQKKNYQQGIWDELEGLFSGY